MSSSLSMLSSSRSCGNVPSNSYKHSAMGGWSEAAGQCCTVPPAVCSARSRNTAGMLLIADAKGSAVSSAGNRGGGKWQPSFVDPAGWRDSRSTEADPEMPDFGERLTRDVLWRDRVAKPRNTPSSEQGVENEQERRERLSHLWHEFFADPSQWWDNRLDKRTPTRPDFRHKTKNEVLWINSWFKPPWVEAQLASLPSNQETGGRFSGPPAPCSEDDLELQRLCREGHLQQALNALHTMDLEPSVQTYGHLLQVCVKKKALTEGKQVHAQIIQHGLEQDSYLGELLVHMFVKCGSLADAVQVFSTLSKRTVFSWTAVISGYVEHKQPREALRLYTQMRDGGIQPSKYTLVAMLKVCALLGDIEKGRRIHFDVVSCKWDSESFVCASIIAMYAKCGSMTYAQQVFDGMSNPDVVSWTTMIAGYVQHGQVEKALQLYLDMQEAGVTPNERTVVSVLKACGMLAVIEREAPEGQLDKGKALKVGKAIHEDVSRRGLDSNEFVGSSLIHMYAKCGNIFDARRVFDALSQRNVVCWNTMITGYVQQEQGENALELFAEMERANVKPDDRTFVSVLKACGIVAAMEEPTVINGQSVRAASLDRGRAIHAAVRRRGYESNVFVGNTLVDMYAKCGSILDARHVFDKLSQQDVVSWNAIITAYAQQEQGERALHFYAQMQEAGVGPDDRTFVSVLKACTLVADMEEERIVNERSVKVQSLQLGRDIHSEIIKAGYASDTFVGNTLIHMYATCGSVEDARNVFDNLGQRNVVSWNAMISGYAEQDEGEKAVQLYLQMQENGVTQNDATFLSILKACSNVGALNTCLQIHQDIIQRGLQHSVTVARSLIHAYGKCGSMEHAIRVFDLVSQHDVVSWTSIIAGYARLGESEQSLQTFRKMKQTGMRPDAVTFVSVLSACSHAGKVEEGLEFFRSMGRDYGISATTSHFASLVDLLGRAGLLSKAKRVIQTMPMRPSLAVWFSLLSACRKYIHVELGEQAFQQAIKLGPTKGAAYVLMSNIYAHAQLWDKAMEIEESRDSADACKDTSQSWMEYEGQVHTFMVGDNSHPQGSEIYAKLKELSTQV